MAIVTNAFSSYDAKGVRESLADAIYNITPYDTPILSMIGKESVSAVQFDWQTDTLPSVTMNKQLEGDQLSRSSVTATTRVINTCQISWRDATVTETNDKTKAAGRKSEMAYQMVRAARALKRDIETVIGGNQGRAAGAVGTARQTRSLESWINTNVSTNGGTLGTDTTARTDGTARSLTETLLKNVLLTGYGNGMEAKYLICGPAAKQIVSAFAGRGTTSTPLSIQPENTGKIVASATLYESDFGTLTVLPDRFVAFRTSAPTSRTAFLIDPEMLAACYLREFETYELGRIGDATTKYIVAEWGLKVKNEAGIGAIFDLTP